MLKGSNTDLVLFQTNDFSNIHDTFLYISASGVITRFKKNIIYGAIQREFSKRCYFKG